MANFRNQYEWYNPGGILGGGFGVREQRGGVVQTPQGPRVEIRRPDGTTTLGHISPTMDADLNPTAILTAEDRRKEQAAQSKAEGLYERKRQDDLTVQDNTYQLGLVGLQHQIQSSQNQFSLLQKRLEQEADQAKDANALNRYTIDRQTAIQAQGLDLKGLEMQANINLQQDNMALRREELGQLRGSQRLAFIGQAMQALMA